MNEKAKSAPEKACSQTGESVPDRRDPPSRFSPMCRGSRRSCEPNRVTGERLRGRIIQRGDYVCFRHTHERGDEGSKKVSSTYRTYEETRIFEYKVVRMKLKLLARVKHRTCSTSNFLFPHVCFRRASPASPPPRRPFPPREPVAQEAPPPRGTCKKKKWTWTWR